VSYEPPTLETWQEWRAALPAVPDIRNRRGPTNQVMRAALAEIQGHLCALCLAVGKFLVLDHDHETGLARGMICRACNIREGYWGFDANSPVFAAYHANPPAAGAGWIWDSYGSVGRTALARARAAGDLSAISCIAPADLAAATRPAGQPRARNREGLEDGRADLG
jgi:Recombination endonuclease VII